MDDLRSIVLLAAAVTSGLAAGVFVLYAHTVMPGLAKTDDRTFVAAFQAIDRQIINPWFLVGGFLGAPVLTGVAAVLMLSETGFVLVAVALALHLVTFVITVRVHVPRNDALKAAGEPDQIDVAAARTAFDEALWVRWNLVRVVTSTGAFGLLCWALLVHAANNVR